MASPDPTSADIPPHVILIEDETVFRQLLKRSLEKRKGWKQVEDYANGAVGLQACLENPPDLLLVDLQLPGKHGLDIVSELLKEHPDVKVLVLTGHAEPQLPGKLMRLGVAGFVDKTAPLAYVIQAIDTVMAGGMFFASHVQAESTSVGGSLPPASEVPPSALSARELEVACLVAAGRSSKEVASDLDLSTRTVEKHRANIMEKLGVREVASLVRWVLQNGLG
ncbi:MAG: UvrY/SirA/GacA family response regulator transcription factor [Synoicihabitans sp.]